MHRCTKKMISEKIQSVEWTLNMQSIKKINDSCVVFDADYIKITLENVE